jgi:hypothetical protein
MAGFCKHGMQSSGFIKYNDFLSSWVLTSFLTEFCFMKLAVSELYARTI